MHDVGQGDDTVMARAVYEATAAEYVRLVGSAISGATETPEDRRMLADLLGDARIGPVADLGSGPGRVAAMCREHGVESIAVDMAVAMLRVGNELHRQVPFVAGDLLALPFAPGSFGGAVLWYSIIHTPPADLGALFSEVRRVIAAGSPVLVAFQAGDGAAHERTNAYGTAMTMISWRHDPPAVAAALTGSGFSACDMNVRAPELLHETTPQAFLRARASP